MNRLLRDELEEKRGRLSAICRKHGVVSLDLFGSGATDDWRPAESDLDFLVTFHSKADRSIADRYLGLAEDLEALFGRPVELLTARSIRNPYFRRSVDAARAAVYAE